MSTPALTRMLILGAALALLAWIAVRLWAEVTVLGAFYDALGMGGVYSTRLGWAVWLGVAGAVASVVLCLPALALARGIRDVPSPAVEMPDALGDPPSDDEITRMAAALDPADLLRPPPPAGGRHHHVAFARRACRAAFGVGLAVVASVLIPGAIALRDPLLAARHAAPFGVTDPVFGRDASFAVFTVPAWSQMVQLASVGLFLALCVVLVAAATVWYAETQRGGGPVADVFRARGLTWGLLLGGGLLVTLGLGLWLSRYGMLASPGATLAGPGRAARHIDIPSRGVAAAAIVAMGLVLLAFAVPALRHRWMPGRRGPATVWALAVWAAVAVGLVAFASIWWVVLLAVVMAAGALAQRAMAPHQADAPLPLWAIPAFAASSAVVLGMAGPVGAALYDAVVLRGPYYQVERQGIADTLTATRRASGLDQAQVRQSPYRRSAVTAADLQRAPASVQSLRMLDVAAALEACNTSQLPRELTAYRCDDIDISRMTIGGRKLTVAIAGREIDPAARTDFQRTHLGFTHGYGVVVAPVERLSAAGRPVWVARGIPQTGITPPLAHPEIYFGAARRTPWALVNTDQPVLNGRNPGDLVTDWCRDANAAACGGEGGTGIALDSGWRRLASAMYLGGLPIVGDGRRFLGVNADGVQLLLFRDLTARVSEIAPFLHVDNDPYFAPAGGRLWVVAPAYVRTDRYPYAAQFGGANYMRQPVLVAMDAYSGQTHLFVLDESEPMLATWRGAYPGLFTPRSRMDALAPGLREQIRYGEDLFAFQTAAVERFHVVDPQVLASGSAQWAVGAQVGAGGTESTPSTARYTFLRGSADEGERFSVMRTFTVARSGGSGDPSGLAGILTASSDAEDFGRLTLDAFPGDNPPTSMMRFGALVNTTSSMASQLRLQTSAVWGESMVVPMGRGLLYAMPIYLNANGAQATIFRVVVSDGAERVVWAPTLQGALAALLGGTAPGPAPTGAAGRDLAAQAQEELRLYTEATAAGKYEEAGRHLERLKALLTRLQPTRRAR